jgi:methyl-accepting chemotaxis protein
MKNIESLKIKIVILLSVLIIAITIIMTTLYIKNLNTLVDSNIELFSTTLLSKEKEELINKIDLASNVLRMYYQQTKPEYIENVVKQTLISHQQQLFSQLESFYKLHKDNLPPKILQESLKFLVRDARYGKNGYFWINNMDYKMIMHPIKPQYEGKVFIQRADVPFVELGVDTLKKNHKQEAFIKYKFYNPATNKYEFKVSLVKIFKPFNWVIGTGQYLSDITPLVKQRALADIKALRYGTNGYFWINDTDYKMIMHPIRPEYNGKKFINSKEVPFVELGVKALNNTKKDSAIIQYVFYNPATKKSERKLSIVKIFKPWNWIIGTGVYLNEIDNSIAQVTNLKDSEEEKFVYKIVFLAIFIILLTISVAYYLISNFIIEPFENLNNEKIHFQEISQIDYLTNVLNRRAFFDEAEQYFAYAHRNNLTVALLMMDIDHFKDVNDTYGHEAGDKVLKKVASIVKSSIRKEDLFGRIGGEEFCVSLLNTDMARVKNVANKIVNAIRESSVIYEDKEIKFTLSIGIYIVSDYSEEFREALNKSDNALYKAKKEGRNKIEIY